MTDRYAPSPLLPQALKGCLTWEQQTLVDDNAPTHVVAPTGSRLRVDYSGSEPSVAVRIQEMFGLADSPRVCNGRVPLIIELLSPAQRPMQV